LEKFKGLPLITIGGERMPRGEGPGEEKRKLTEERRPQERRRKNPKEMSDEELIAEAKTIAERIKKGANRPIFIQ
jgi:hypothetical protein